MKNRSLMFLFVILLAPTGCYNSKMNTKLGYENDDEETRASIQAYLSFNGLSPATFSIGMPIQDVIKVLGQPTGTSVDGWMSWYHNPGYKDFPSTIQKHVAPTIRMKVKDGRVREIEAGRG